jgi:hypothetical protein
VTLESKLSSNKKSLVSDQPQRFINFAREVEADEDEGRWDERLRKVANGKPHKASDGE